MSCRDCPREATTFVGAYIYCERHGSDAAIRRADWKNRWRWSIHRITLAATRLPGLRRLRYRALCAWSRSIQRRYPLRDMPR